MADDDIVQRIKITAEGGDQVAEQYQIAGDAAEKAAEQITKAGESGGDGFTQAGEAAAQAADDLAKLGDAAQQLQDKIAESTDSFGKVSDSISNAAEAAQKFSDSTDQLQAAGTAFDDLAAKSDDAGKAIAQASEGLAQSGEAADAAATGVDKVGEAASGAAEGIAKVGDAADQMSGKLDVIGQAEQSFSTAAESAKTLTDELTASNAAASDFDATFKQITDDCEAVHSCFADLGANADAAAQAFDHVAQESERAVEDIQKIADVTAAAAGGLDKLAQSAGAAGDAAQGITISINNSGQAVQDSTQFWASYVLEQEKVAVQAAQTGVAAGELAAKVREFPLEAIKAAAAAAAAVAALTLAIVEAGKLLQSLFSGPSISQQADAFRQAQLEAQKTAAEIALLKAQTDSLSDGFKAANGSIQTHVETVAKIAPAAAAATAGTTQLGEAATLVVKQYADLSDAQKRINDAFTSSGIAGSKLYQTLTDLSSATGQSINTLQVGQQAFEHIGISASKFGDVVVNLKNQLKDLDPARALQDSANSIADATNKIADANLKVLESKRALLQAEIASQASGRASFDQQLQLAELNRQIADQTKGQAAVVREVEAAHRAVQDAVNAAADAQAAKAKLVATSLGTVVEQINKIIAGQKDIKFDEATTAATKIKAVQVALAEIGQTAGKTGADVVQALVQIIATTKNLDDALAIGKQFGFDDAQVKAIRDYGIQVNTAADAVARIPNLFQKIREGGVAIGPEAAAGFDKIKDSIGNIDSASQRLKTAWTNLFPTKDMEDFNTKSVEMTNKIADHIAYVNNLKAAFIGAGASAVEMADAVVQASAKIGTNLASGQFWEVLGGKIGEAAGKFATFFSEVGSSTATMGSDFGKVFTDMVAAAKRFADQSGFTEFRAKAQEDTEAVNQYFYKLWADILSSSKGFFAQLGDSLTTFAKLTGISDAWEAIKAKSKESADASAAYWARPGMWSAFIATAESAITSVGGFFKDLGSSLGIFGKLVGTETGAAWDSFVTAAERAFATVNSSVGGFFTELGNSLGIFTKLVGQQFDDLGASIKKWSSDIGLTALFQSISDGAGKMATSVSNWFGDIGTSFTKLATDIGAVDLWSNFVASAKKAESDVRGVLAQIAGGLAVVFGASPQTGAAIRDWVNGLESVTTAAKNAGTATVDAGKSTVDAAKSAAAANAAVAESLRQLWQNGSLSLDQYRAKLQALNAVKPTITADQYRQQWQDGIISLDQYRSKLEALNSVKPPASKDLYNMWQDGIISLEQYRSKLEQLWSMQPGGVTADELRYLWKTGLISLDEYKSKLDELEKGAATFGTSAQQAAQKGADGIKNLGDTAKQASDSVKKIGDSAGQGVQQIDPAIADLKAKVLDLQTQIQKLSQAPKIPTPTYDLSPLITAAQKGAKDVEKIFSDIKLTLKGSIDFSAVTDAADKAARDIEKTFSGMTLTFSGSVDFSSVVTAAQNAFSNIHLAAPSIDFSSVITSAQATADAVQQIFQALQQLAAVDLSSVIASLQAFLSAVQQIAAVDFGGLISGINNATTAFNAMAEAANNAAAAANAAASAAANAAAAGAGSFARGGLFRGRAGIDTNLAWLSDYEFIMRPEAVMRYGVNFMHMINSLQFPFQGFREGGLFHPGAMVIPSFQAGGINQGGGGRGSSPASMRPLNLTIAGETFGGLLAPEGTAKALERAAIGRQVSSTGTRPRWNK
jgi:hypothetical protein